MAEFKFACARCGQHIQCDTSYTGMQIDCPVCQQSIVVPPPPRAAASAVTPAAAPPLKKKSRVLQNILLIIAAVFVLTALVIGGWFGYSKFKFHSNPILNTPNLLGYWRFAPDAQGKSSFGDYTANFSGNATVGPAGSGPGRHTTSVVLDGNASYVTTTLVGGLVSSGTNANQGSIVAWFKLTALPSNLGRVFFLAGESVYGSDFDLQIESDNRLKFYTDNGSCTTSTDPLTTGNIGVWHFVAATFISGDSRKIYLDGVQVGSSTPGQHDPSRGGIFSIGESRLFTGRYFQGAMAEVAIFNRALSAEEIQRIYAAQK